MINFIKKKSLLINWLILLFIINSTSFAQEEIPPPQEVFIPKINQTKTDNSYTTTINIKINKGYYLYTDKTKLTSSNKNLPIDKSKGKIKNDRFLGKVEVWENSAQITAKHDQFINDFILTMQGCKEDTVCYPPTKWQLSISDNKNNDLTTIQSETTQSINQAEEIAKDSIKPKKEDVFFINALNDNFLAALPLIFLLGIAISFTACAYPLIPIVTSLITGPDRSNYRSYALVAIYVLSMGLAMAFLGAIFGIFQINLQILLQKPLVVVFVSLFFSLMALAMFDAFHLSLPSKWQSKIDKINRLQKGGSFLGAGTMGALSVLVVSPCSTPVLTALLLFATQTTPIKSALTLFIFGIGTGLPLLIFAGALRKFMPKAGNWMIFIKKIFAFGMLGIAFWLVSRITSFAYSYAIWATFTALIAAQILPYWQKAGKTGYFLRLILIITLSLTFSFTTSSISYFNHNNQIITNKTEANFVLLKNQNQIEQALNQSNKPTILYFYADWCVSCKVWQKDIWQNPDLQADFANYQLIKVDVTDFNDAHKEIFKTLKLVGPPAVLIFDQGKKINQAKRIIIGEMSAKDFQNIIKG